MRKILPVLIRTLLSPDQENEEQRERAEIVRAANILQVGEFQLLQLAYHDWYGRDVPAELVDRLFASYMLHGQVPHWARHFARIVIERSAKGMVDDSHPFFHRYDNDYATEVPQGVRRFCHAALILVVLIGGSIFLGHWAADGNATSVLPPYFGKEELRPAN